YFGATSHSETDHKRSDHQPVIQGVEANLVWFVFLTCFRAWWEFI
ncbi:MAG: hypothetical protein ACI8X3_003137, partial [Saprospiraceae bacterium]